MFEFLMFVAIVVLFAMLANMRGRLKRAETIIEEAAKRIGALQRQAGLLPPNPGESFAQAATASPVAPEAPASPTVASLAERWRPKDMAGSSTEIPAPTPAVETTPVVLETIPVPSTATRKESLRAAALVGQRAPTLVELIPSELPVAGSGVTEQPSMPVAVKAAPVGPERTELVDESPLQVAEAAPPPSPPLPPQSPPGPGPAPAPQPAAPPVSTPDLASRFENLFGKTLPIWAGGITLAIAGVLIVRYAIDAGFFARIFTRGVQVISGGLFGLGLIAGAEFAWRNEDRVRDVRVPQALSGAGIATLYAAILVAANAYQLIAPLTAFILLAAVTAGALGLSLRFGAPSALLGLAGGLAAPALVGSVEPNVPLLAVYLGLTISGLTGVSRMRRWPWLALAALVGGAGWSLWMVAAGTALDTLGTLSVGGFVLLLAIALPLLAFDGPRAWLLRSASAIVGALQLALLVALGGFAPLDWGLFALLAVAGQWLAWRDNDYAIVPTISVALSALLLAIWPTPDLYWFTLIGLALAAVHALPLLIRLTNVQRALELCGVTLAAPLLFKWHYAGLPDATLALVAAGGALLAGAGIVRLWRVEARDLDARLAWLASVTAGLLALSLALVGPLWAVPLAIGTVAATLLVFGQTAADRRIEPVAAVFTMAALVSLFATPLVLVELARLLLGTDASLATETLSRLGGMAVLFGFFALRAMRLALRVTMLTLWGGFVYATLAQVVPGWSLPLAMSVVALTVFAIGQRRKSPRIETLGGSFAAAAIVLLAITGPQTVDELSRLLSSDAVVGYAALLRWGGVAGLALFFAARSRTEALQRAAQMAGALLTYGALAQIVPGAWLMFAPAIGVAVTLLAAPRIKIERVAYASATFAALTAAWALQPLLLWTEAALPSLGDVPMMLDTPALAAREVVLRLLVPALLIGGSLWIRRELLPPRMLKTALAVVGVFAGVGLHMLYREGFAAAFGTDFVATGLGQRLLWEALLIGSGWLAARRGQGAVARPLLWAGTAHLFWYSLVLHNPLWNAQAVGAMPALNLIAPLFALAWLGLRASVDQLLTRPSIVERCTQLVAMALVGSFAWATLRQAFQGTLLVTPGVTSAENILRSVLILSLAIGFLLWGIRSQRHDWRIASLVLMLGAVAKVFLFDASGLEGLLRIGSFVVLGFSLIGIGWLYSRQLQRGTLPAPPPVSG